MQIEALFTYGSLEFPAIMHRVTGRRLEHRVARLPGYRRRLLEEEVYPGIAAFAAEQIVGTLYEPVNVDTLAILDLFEGWPYERLRVTVQVEGGGEASAFAYVVPAERSHLLSARDWDSEHFRRHHWDSFWELCERFRAELERGGRASSPV